MPKSLYLLTLCLCFGCVTVQSTQKQLNSGNYDEAITNALKELRPNKTKSKAQPYAFLLQEAFIKAQDRDERSLVSPAAKMTLNALEARVRLLEGLMERQEKIRPILPLFDAKSKKELVFPFKNYSADYQTALATFAGQLEQKVQSGLAVNEAPYFFRDYYEKFAYLERRQLLNTMQHRLHQKCREKGATAAYGVLRNESRNVLPKSVAHCLLDFSKNNALSFWTPYDAYPKKGIPYTIAIQITLTLMEVSPENAKQQLLQFEHEVAEGTQPLRDERGKIVLDSLGEVIEVPKFKKEKATYYRNTQREVVTYSLELLEVYWHKGIRHKQRRYWVFTFMGVLQTTL